MKFAETILDLVGHTPLVKLQRMVDADMADLYVKMDHLNPTGPGHPIEGPYPLGQSKLAGSGRMSHESTPLLQFTLIPPASVSKLPQTLLWDCRGSACRPGGLSSTACFRSGIVSSLSGFAHR